MPKRRCCVPSNGCAWVSKRWEGIGKLAAIVAIRTVLNCFLILELREERVRTLAASGASTGPSTPSAP